MSRSYLCIMNRWKTLHRAHKVYCSFHDMMQNVREDGEREIEVCCDLIRKYNYIFIIYIYIMRHFFTVNVS
jgi:hypothetical protein